MLTPVEAVQFVLYHPISRRGGAYSTICTYTNTRIRAREVMVVLRNRDA